MQNLQKNTNIWCDMDGVIAIYEPDGFCGENPPFLIPNSHYFRNCIPDLRIIQALQLLNDIYHIPIKIISNVHESLKQEHHNDKYDWLKQHTPFINIDKNYHTIINSKATYVEKLKRKALTKSDILISDYNGDLKKWSESGGTGIKYANGINNPHSYDGLYIPEKYTSKQIANQIIDIIYEIENK